MQLRREPRPEMVEAAYLLIGAIARDHPQLPEHRQNRPLPVVQQLLRHLGLVQKLATAVGKALPGPTIADHRLQPQISEGRFRIGKPKLNILLVLVIQVRNLSGENVTINLVFQLIRVK